jgi:hypothetical protein
MPEQRANAVGNFLRDTVLQSTRAGLHEIVPDAEDVYEQSLGQARPAHDGLRFAATDRSERNVAVLVSHVAVIDGALQSLDSENVFAVTRLEKVVGSRKLLSFRFFEQHRQQLLEKLLCVDLVVAQASHLPTVELGTPNPSTIGEDS